MLVRSTDAGMPLLLQPPLWLGWSACDASSDSRAAMTSRPPPQATACLMSERRSGASEDAVCPLDDARCRNTTVSGGSARPSRKAAHSIASGLVSICPVAWRVAVAGGGRALACPDARFANWGIVNRGIVMGGCDYHFRRIGCFLVPHSPAEEHFFCVGRAAASAALGFFFFFFF